MVVVKTGLQREGEEDLCGDTFRSERISKMARTTVLTRTMVVVMVEDAVAMTTVGEEGGWERRWCGLCRGIKKPQGR